MASTALMLAALFFGLMSIVFGILSNQTRTRTRRESVLVPSFGSPAEYTPVGWRYRKVSILCLVLGASALVVAWVLLN